MTYKLGDSYIVCNRFSMTPPSSDSACKSRVLNVVGFCPLWESFCLAIYRYFEVFEVYTLHNFAGYYFLWRPPTSYPHNKSGFGYVQVLSPLPSVHSFAIYSYAVVGSCVIALSFLGGPSDISGLVVAVCIYSIYRMFLGWSWPDKAIKFHKALSPLFTDCYTSAAVIFKSIVVRVIASVDHMPINIVLRSFRLPVCCDFLSFKTPTTASFLADKITRTHRNYITARTLAFKISSFFAVRGVFFKNGKSGKGLTRSIDKNLFWHVNLQAQVASIKKRGRQLLECCFSGDPPYPHNIFNIFLSGSQEKEVSYGL